MGYRPNSDNGSGATAHSELTGNSGEGCHPISAITGLQAGLDGKAPTHSHPYEAVGAVAAHAAANDPHPVYLKQAESDVLYDAVGSAAAERAAHEAAADPHSQYTTAAEAAAAAPVQSVAGRSGAVTLAKADVGLGSVDNTSDAAKPVSTATQAALNAKQATSEKGQANGYASLGADGKVPSGQLPASGSDPWTYLRLANDFTTTSNTAVDITGLGFTPVANTRYEVEGVLRVRTATATVGPRPGVAWPTGCTDGVADVRVTSSATAEVQAKGNINASVLAPVGGLPNTTQSYPAFIQATFDAGASPGGSFRAQLASETAGTTVTAKAGSFIKYRTVP